MKPPATPWGGEGAEEDLDERVRDRGCVGAEDDEAADDVENRHGRDEDSGDLGQGLDAADDDEPGEDRDDDSEQPPVIRQPGPERARAGDLDELGDGLVRLEGIGAQSRDHHEERPQRREDSAQPGLPDLGEPVAQVVHRPAGGGSVRMDAAMLHCEEAFGHLRRHCKESGDDEPEGSTRPSDADRDCDAGDVAQSYGRGQRGGQGLEVTDLAHGVGRGEATSYEVDGMFHPTDIEELQPQGEEHPEDDEPEHDDRDLGAEDRQREEHHGLDRLGEGAEVALQGRVEAGGRGIEGEDIGDVP